MRRILVVDDIEDNLYTLEYLLKAQGYEVTTAQSGPRALEAVAESKANFDLVLLDVMMPGMDGFEVCQRLKGDDKTKQIPIIILTAHARESQDVVKGFEVGADDYITKPFQQAELLARVKAILRTTELREELVKAEAAKLEEELAVARKVQLSLLPDRIPELPGFEMVAGYLPSEKVGGDYYDVMPIDDAHTSIVMADVEGHGIGAAMLMSSVRTALRMELMHGFSLNKIMFDMNNYVCTQLPELNTMPMIYAVLNTDIKVLSYVNAGHDYPILLREGSDDIEDLESTGLVMGVAEDMQYGEVHIPLKAGDLILFYTDGLSDALNEKDDFFNRERIIEVLKTSRHLTLDQISETIASAVTTWRGRATQNDDIAYIILKTE